MDDSKRPFPKPRPSQPPKELERQPAKPQNEALLHRFANLEAEIDRLIDRIREKSRAGRPPSTRK